MKINYLAVFDGNIQSGVSKKIMGQINGLRNLGINANLVLLSRVPLNSLPSFIKVNVIHSAPFTNNKEKIVFMSEIANEIEHEAKECNIIYFRGLIPSPFLARILRKKRETKVIFEIQSIVENEAKMRSAWANYILCKLFIPSIIKYADGIVGVTEEITQHYAAYSPDIPNTTISNGIDVTSVPIRNQPSFEENTLNLMCLANVSKWHGLDRVIKGLSLYHGHVKVNLHIIGEGSEIPFLKGLVKLHGLGKIVHFHGLKTSTELDLFFDSCHIAIGSIGAHRKGLKEVAELKTREYCSRGIPFVSASKDKDFLKSFKYQLSIPANDDPVDIEQLIDFAQNIVNDPQHSEYMRDFAKTKLDWGIKTKELASFLSRLEKRF